MPSLTTCHDFTDALLVPQSYLPRYLTTATATATMLCWPSRKISNLPFLGRCLLWVIAPPGTLSTRHSRVYLRMVLESADTSRHAWSDLHLDPDSVTAKYWFYASHFHKKTCLDTHPVLTWQTALIIAHSGNCIRESQLIFLDDITSTDDFKRPNVET
jgi:hypothetical protein